MTKIYTIINEPIVIQYEEKKSQFYAQLWSATSKEEISQYLQVAKERYPDARHHCWAYIIGNPKQASSAGFNDDGEPSGTAGKPIMNVLTQRNIGDVYAVVSRYFGGIKLGAGGLVRAYSHAVSEALNHAQLTQVIPKTTLSFIIDYAQEDLCRQILDQHSAVILDVEYSSRVRVHCEIIIEKKQITAKMLQNCTSGTIEFC